MCERSRWCTDCLCILKMLGRLKDLSHRSHEYGFSPVCMNKCVFSWAFIVKRLSHIWHTCARVCWWIDFICFFNVFGYAYETPHSSQTYGRSPVNEEIFNKIKFRSPLCQLTYFKRLYYTCVRAKMHLELVLWRIAFITMITLEFANAFMNIFYVRQQLERAVKWTIAYFTFMPLLFLTCLVQLTFLWFMLLGFSFNGSVRNICIPIISNGDCRCGSGRCGSCYSSISNIFNRKFVFLL